MNGSEQKDLLFAALAKAQAEIKGSKEDSTNPFFKCKYSDLTSVWAACREPLTSNSLSVTQTLEIRDSHQCLVSILGHSSGQWVESVMLFQGECKTPQDLGKLITYYRRYMLAALVGVCPEDDDAEGMMQKVRARQEETEERRRNQEALAPMPEPKMMMKEDLDLMTLIGDDIEYRTKIFSYYAGKMKCQVKSFLDIPLSEYQIIRNKILANNKEKAQKHDKAPVA